MELRIFFNPEIIPFKLRKMALGSRYKKPAPEKRTDVYFNLDDPALGLKFRATKSRLELKIRTSVMDSGVEIWTKTQIDGVSNDSEAGIAAALGPYTTASSANQKAHFARCQQLLSSGKSFERVTIAKSRRIYSPLLKVLGVKSQNSEKRVMMEQTKITVIRNGKSESWRSICAEGTGSADLLVESMNAVISAMKSNGISDEAIQSGTIWCGYPEFISRVCAKSSL